jgi:uncharacterized protein (TIGR03437 family)
MRSVGLAVLMAGSSFVLVAQPRITAVANSASMKPGLPGGGALASIFMSGVEGAAPGVYVAASQSPLPTQLAGFQVLVNFAYAPILAVAVSVYEGTTFAQVNIQVPLERNASLVGSYGGAMQACYSDRGCADVSPLPARAWGAFFSDASGYVVAQHASDFQPVSPDYPARPGESIVAYADDLFVVWPPTPIGAPAPAQPLSQYLRGFLVPGFFAPGYLYLQDYPFFGCHVTVPPSGTVCEAPPTTPPLKMTFRGLTPGLVGVQQINFIVPAGQQPGAYPLFFNNGCYDGFAGPEGCAPHPTESPYALLPVGK